ncbi:MAG: aspartate aminotransferase family protein [Thermotaleaceae bacterium]
MKNLYERSMKVMPQAAGRATKLEIEKGKGAYLYDFEGNQYLDFASGVAVCNVGHNHERVIEAAKAQIDKLIHGGHNVVYYEPYVELAEKLVDLTGKDTMVYFSNSGAEANDGAIKLAKYATERPAILAFKGSFHGRTIGAMSITSSNAKYRKHYEAVLPSVYFAEYPNCFDCPFKQRKESCHMECSKQFKDIFDKLIDPHSIAGIIIEPIQGEGGYVTPPKAFLKDLRKICDDHGICLIFDEVQTGFGRTGKMFAYEHFEVKPDIFTCAKAMASGFPLSAVIAKKEIMEKWSAGAHGGTFGGNPVACAAALATISILEEGAVANSEAMGQYFREKLEALKNKYDVISDIRGIGLMIGMEFRKSDGSPNPDRVKHIINHAIEHRLILLDCGTYKNILRFIAPTTVTTAEIDMCIKILEEALSKEENQSSF